MVPSRRVLCFPYWFFRQLVQSSSECRPGIIIGIGNLPVADEHLQPAHWDTAEYHKQTNVQFKSSALMTVDVMLFLNNVFPFIAPSCKCSGSKYFFQPVKQENANEVRYALSLLIEGRKMWRKNSFLVVSDETTVYKVCVSYWLILQFVQYLNHTTARKPHKISPDLPAIYMLDCPFPISVTRLYMA